MKTRLLGGGGQLQLYLCGGWLWVCCGSWIRGMGSWGVLRRVLPECGPCDCLGNSSIRYRAGVFGYKYCGLLRSSTNNKIRVCGWCKFGLFVFCFASVVIMSLSLEEGVDVEVGSEEWEERFLEKLLVNLKETVKEKEVGVPQSGASGSGPSSSQSEGG